MNAARTRRIHRTPRTTLHWSTLAEWYEAAIALEQRRASALKNRCKQLHIEILPLGLIARCDCLATLTACRDLLRYRAHRPVNCRPDSPGSSPCGDRPARRAVGITVDLRKEERRIAWRKF